MDQFVERVGGGLSHDQISRECDEERQQGGIRFPSQLTPPSRSNTREKSNNVNGTGCLDFVSDSSKGVEEIKAVPLRDRFDRTLA